jgi:hypothetical protein
MNKKSSATSVADKLASALPDMAFTLTSNGRYTGFLPGGDVGPVVPPEQFIGRRIQDVIGEEIAGDVLPRIRRVLETQRMETFEYSLNSDKGIRRFEARVSPVDADEVVALVRDVTELRLGNAEHDQLLSLLAAAREAIELAAPHLPKDSDADIAAARALSGIYRLDSLVLSDVRAGD